VKTLEKYREDILAGIGLPSVLAQLNVEASADFGRYSELYAKAEIDRAKFIKRLHDEGASMSSAENEWITTEEGEKWIFLKHYIRGLKQITKSIDSATYVANAEMKNQC
jgi:hypothetical protein